jgi:NAD-dependent dihydropyrimidine dehydrogenase PreA subunit
MNKNPEKTLRAALHPLRPGAECKAEPGAYRPAVDARRCEGKGDCLEVCPYQVFEIGRLDDETFRALPALTRFKLWAHGRKTAYTPGAEACRACGLCVVACPERAISLVATQAG